MVVFLIVQISQFNSIVVDSAWLTEIEAKRHIMGSETPYKLYIKEVTIEGTDLCKKYQQ